MQHVLFTRAGWGREAPRARANLLPGVRYQFAGVGGGPVADCGVESLTYPKSVDPTVFTLHDGAAELNATGHISTIASATQNAIDKTNAAARHHPAGHLSLLVVIEVFHISQKPRPPGQQQTWLDFAL